MNPLLIRRRGMMKAQQGGLPYDAEIEYLKSDGNQKIITPITGTENVKIELRYKLTDTSHTSYILGTSESSENTTIRCYIANSSNWRFGGRLRQMSVRNTNWYTLTIDKNTITLNGTNYPWNSGSVGTFSDGKIALFGLRTHLTGYPSIVSYCTIYDNGILVFDAIPVRIGQVGYMYDQVSGQLFGNDGTGSFTLGPDVP